MVNHSYHQFGPLSFVLDSMIMNAYLASQCLFLMIVGILSIFVRKIYNLLICATVLLIHVQTKRESCSVLALCYSSTVPAMARFVLGGGVVLSVIEFEG